MDTIRTSFRDANVDIPRDRNAEFEPKIGILFYLKIP